MKKLFILLFSILTIHVANAQSCLPEGITFTTQAQIDSFAINYPGCTEIEGNVIVAGNDITNLNGLNVIVTVGGDLSVHNNAILTSLSGLDNLTSIGGYLEISRNDSLSSLIGLRNVTAIGESVYIGSQDILWGGNPELTNLNGLEGLTSIEGDLYIGLNIALVSLSGLDNLISIGGNFSVRFTALNNLEGLEKLTSIEGYLNIDSNGILTSLMGLDNIDSGSISYLSIYNNELLSTCDVKSICDFLASPNGTIEIYENAPGCNSPEEVEEECLSRCLPEGITFTSQAQIDSFQIMYPNCTEIEGWVFIGIYPGGSDISSLTGLNVLTSTGGDFYIGGNGSLSNLVGLDNLTSIGGRLTIGVDGWMGTAGNSLTSLDGLDNLGTIGGQLDIKSNPLLSNISALENMTSIGNFIVLEDNQSLINISGLTNIDAGTISGIAISDNASISNCNVESICTYLATPDALVTIENNAPGCNSQQEVEDACSFFVEDMEENHAISIYPNPATNELFIVCNNGIQLTEVNIYNQLGQKVLHRMGNTRQIDVSDLQNGLYIIELFTDKSKFRRKLVVE